VKKDFDFEASLLANANADGDNVHRGMILGLLKGAASMDLPESLIKRLVAYEELKNEIETFAEIAVRGDAMS